MTIHIYLEAIDRISDPARVCVTLDSYVCLFVHRYLSAPKTTTTDDDPPIGISFVQPPLDEQKPPRVRPAHAFPIDLTAVPFQLIEHADYHASRLAAMCQFPVLLADADVVIAGLCAVCRRMVRSRSGRETLLGFKGGCMLAPAEQSVWTRFCEIDVVGAVQKLLAVVQKEGEETGDAELLLPPEFARFELHMAQPVRMHNIYKVAREQAVEQKQQQLKNKEADVADDDLVAQINEVLHLNAVDKKPREKKPRKKPQPAQISSSVPMRSLDIAHTFAEGPELTLADVMLFACFGLAYDRLVPGGCVELLRLELPLFSGWLDSVRSQMKGELKVLIAPASADKVPTLRLDRSDSRSLYKNDSKRYKPRSQIFTKQPDIEAALAKVHALGLDISSAGAPRYSATAFDWWHSLPYDALPEGGALPAKRLLRKQHQLQSLAVEVLRLAQKGARVVDFCSGAGHLGIVVAALRPDCEVVLLENKEESLQRARQRCQRMGLANVRYVQCNLDYWWGRFEVGASLHACGVATDLVLEHCMRRRAAFVCCPCCYGGCRGGVSEIEYPRSGLFGRRGGMTSQDCMHVAHCADQAHDVRAGPCNEVKAAQGQQCMDVVDWDRKVCAEERGYEVVELTRLQPEECTPKNRLLVGEWRRR